MKFRVNQATKYCSLLLFLLTSILGVTYSDFLNTETFFRISLLDLIEK